MMSSSLRTLTAALVAAALSLSPASASLPSARTTWRSLETPNFRIVGEVSAGKLVEAAEQLEAFRAVLARLAPGTAARPAMPVTVIVFSKDRDFWPYAFPQSGRPEDLAGYFRTTRWGDYMLLVADSRTEDPYELLYPGYVHQVLANGYARLPAWLHAGLSEFYRTFHLTAKTFEIGRPARHHLRTVREGWRIPVARLVTLDSASPELAQSVVSDSFYAESWALVHDLLIGDPEMASRVPDLLARLGRGEPSETALPAALGISLDELDRRLTLYAQKSLFRYLTYPRGDLAVPAHGDPAEMSRAEALGVLAEYLAHAGEVEKAREHLDAAVEAGGDNGDLEALAGYLAESAGDAAQASARYDRALTLPVRRVASYVHVARFDLDHAGAAGAGGEDAPRLSRALDASARATELDPECGEAWALRGLLLLDHGDDEEAMAVLARAQLLLPGRSDVAHNRFVAAMNAGQLTVAQGIATQTLARLDAEQARQAIAALNERRQSDLARQALRDSNRALDDGRFDDAIELLRAAGAQLPDGEARLQVEQRLATLEPYVAERKLIERYQHASTLSQQRKYAQARDEVRGVLADCAGQRVCQSAQELLDWLDRQLGRKR